MNIENIRIYYITIGIPRILICLEPVCFAAGEAAAGVFFIAVVPLGLGSLKDF
jgi:hypothetical protein